MCVKTILIVLPDHFSVRNFLYSPFIEQNFAKNNIRVVFVLRNCQNHQGQISNKANLFLEELAPEPKNLSQKISARQARLLLFARK